ncbi:hypothetical protein [uncultured Aquimarina sp.]|uniref:hypothetical protein n=1 Tax=uncultured Aquimarina sp. TaxID=575652 RepID=UPI002603C974|nr:hypothetical protein [uncultured Aquimarina sp.]
MKKITLLLVAAVFAIGIQSCSTDEIGIEEENLIKQENVEMKATFNTLNADCEDCMSVFYSESMNFEEISESRSLMRLNVLSTLAALNGNTNSCGYNEEWVYEGYNRRLLNESGVIITEEKKVASVTRKDDDPIRRNYILSETIIGDYRFTIYETDGTSPICNQNPLPSGF